MRKHDIEVLKGMIEEIRESVKLLPQMKGNMFGMLCKGVCDALNLSMQYLYSAKGNKGELPDLYARLGAELQESLQAGCASGEINTTVEKVEKCLREIKPDRIEVAFFCYKASMADALESIFFTALSDPDCDAYFIPIPYFELGANLQPIRVCFEGAGYYPEDWPLTDYRAYKVEERRPDVIFIMNPYDEMNRTTRVHEDYYSKRLRNYTEHLVYVEYGLPTWMYRDIDGPEVCKIPSLCPAHIWSHHYIAFTKEIEMYFRHFLPPGIMINDEISIPKDAPEDRFLALGSPKFDKLINTAKEDYVIPEEWEKPLSGKKVILYATSLGELLRSTKKEAEEGEEIGRTYFSKLEEILTAFKNRSDVALWWRPHPLFETTLQSLHPDLEARYRALVSEFCTWENGIFDTSAEVTRAVQYCDGMITDESSLMWLALAKGKPFYIPAVFYARKNPVIDADIDFKKPLRLRLERMRSAKGANSINCNTCIWWHNFEDEDFVNNIRFEHFPERFADFIVHPDKYSEYDEYRNLLIQMFKDFVVNPDGTAGKKIYECMKNKALGVKDA